MDQEEKFLEFNGLTLADK